MQKKVWQSKINEERNGNGLSNQLKCQKQDRWKTNQEERQDTSTWQNELRYNETPWQVVASNQCKR